MGDPSGLVPLGCGEGSILAWIVPGERRWKCQNLRFQQDATGYPLLCIACLAWHCTATTVFTVVWNHGYTGAIPFVCTMKSRLIASHDVFIQLPCVDWWGSSTFLMPCTLVFVPLCLVFVIVFACAILFAIVILHHCSHQEICPFLRSGSSLIALNERNVCV